MLKYSRCDPILPDLRVEPFGPARGIEVVFAKSGDTGVDVIAEMLKKLDATPIYLAPAI